MVACNCSAKGWIAAANKRGPGDPLAAHQPPMGSESAHRSTVTKGAGSTRYSPCQGREMGLDINQNVLAGNLIEGFLEIQFEENMVNLLHMPLNERTSGMHNCLYPIRHGHAHLRWPEMVPGHLPDMYHEAFGGESPQRSANCNGGKHRPLALAAR